MQAMAAGKPPASSAAVDVDSDLDGAEEWATAKTGPTSRPDNRPTCQLRIVLMYELFAQVRGRAGNNKRVCRVERGSRGNISAPVCGFVNL